MQRCALSRSAVPSMRMIRTHSRCSSSRWMASSCNGRPTGSVCSACLPAGRSRFRPLASAAVRLTRLLICWLLSSFIAVWAGSVQADETLTADIAPQPVADALAEFARQTGLQVIYLTPIATQRTSAGARTGMSPSDALTRLLDGTGLRFRFLNDRTVRIYVIDQDEGTPAPAPPPPRPKPAEHAPPSPSTLGDEVVVIGSRGAERLTQVPVSVTVRTSEALERSGARTLEAIAGLTPGVEYD